MPKPKSELPMEEIVARYRAGESATTMAPYYGVSHETLIKRLREAGAEVRPQYERRPLNVEEMIARYRSGENVMPSRASTASP